MTATATDMATAYDEALALLAEDIAAYSAEVSQLAVPRPVSILLWGAANSVAMGFGGAAANRLNTARGIMTGRITVASDEDAVAAADYFNEQFPAGTPLHSTLDGETATVDGVAHVEAETNKVFVRLRFAKGYGTRYITDLTEIA